MKYWRNQRISGWRERAAFSALALVVLVCGAFLLGFTLLRPTPQTFGVTFSSKYAESLGLDSEETLTAIFDDLNVQDVRLPVYWSDVETSPGIYDWSQLDALLTLAESRDVSVTLVVGMKVPRWPECFIPAFYQDSSGTFDAEVLRFVQATVVHARQFRSITRWQVENEPLFAYGECPKASLDRLRNEVALVRALDERPIMVTVSGEQEAWLDVASLSDVVGVSVYRFAYQNIAGPISFPFGPMYYRLHAFITRFYVRDVVISELQMEPWFTGNPQDPSSLNIPFSVKDFHTHLQFAKDTGLNEILLWGVEWWYYEHMHGEDGLWNAARDTFHVPLN